eukprot:gene3313-2494_t
MSMSDQLTSLALQLLKGRALTDAEFASAKQKVLVHDAWET